MPKEINFFKEGVTFTLWKQDRLRGWIEKVVAREKYKIDVINFIFCTDRYLRKINKEYLQHDYNTDVVTFDNSVEKGLVNGDIFISVDRIRINAKEYSTTFNDELHRVMVHGVLHLVGYEDKNEKSKKEMKVKENSWLTKR